uniref:Fe2OG dioxygenase domain-containing protein n=1 Tax=Timema poppense TaxID=170557 RepID=A0A7R9DDL5_TIMPO|nr:unnamed protein product [Timema poppensis]
MFSPVCQHIGPSVLTSAARRSFGRPRLLFHSFLWTKLPALIVPTPMTGFSAHDDSVPQLADVYQTLLNRGMVMPSRCPTPPTVFYVPEFITEEEEKRLIEQVNLAPKPKWTQLAHRRLQNWGGIPHPKGMIAEKIPDWLLEYTRRIETLGLFEGKALNHVLINEYLPGQGILPHFDGSLFYPTVSTVSCGSHTVLEFHHPPQGDVSFGHNLPSLLVEPRSLLVLQDDLYHKYHHSIAEVTQDTITDRIANLGSCRGRYTIGQCLQRQTRLSLTIRHVPRTSKLQIKLGR